MEQETAASELRLSNTTRRLVQLEREVGRLRQNGLRMNQLVDRAEQDSHQAKQEAELAEKVRCSLCGLLQQRSRITTHCGFFRVYRSSKMT